MKSTFAKYRRVYMWGTIALIFVAMGAANIVWALGHPPHFNLAWPTNGADMQVGSGNLFQPPVSLSQQLHDFADAFNGYVDAQSHDAMLANLLGALANLIAAATAIFSAHDEWKSARKRASTS